MTEQAPQKAGDHLAQWLKLRNWSQTDLAEVLNRPLQFVNEIVNSKKEITRESAAQLAAAFGTSPTYWLALQQEYKLWELSRHEPTQRKLADIRARAAARRAR